MSLKLLCFCGRDDSGFVPKYTVVKALSLKRLVAQVTDHQAYHASMIAVSLNIFQICPVGSDRGW